MTKKEFILLALLDNKPLPTKQNVVIAPLCQAGLVNVVEYTSSGMIKKIELTVYGKVVANMIKKEKKNDKN